MTRTNRSAPLPQSSSASAAQRDAIHARRQWAGRARTFAIYAALIGLAVLFMLPFIYMVSLSFQTNQQAFAFPPSLIPNPFTLEGYRKVLDGTQPITLYARNSILVAVLSTAGSVLSCAMAGYAFARVNFKGRNALFLLLLATTFIPAQVNLIPMYIMFNRFGWIDTLYPLIVPNLFGAAIGTFLLRQFFMSLPQVLEDAAIIDGANRLQVFTRIMLPLAAPAMATWAILSFMASWNDLMTPLVFTNSRELRTLPLAIAFMNDPYYQTTWYVARLGLSALTTLPLVILFFAAQKYVIQGIARTGIK